jgi:hypothetical protein
MTADIVSLAEYRAAKTETAAHAPPEVSVVEAVEICLARYDNLTPWECDSSSRSAAPAASFRPSNSPYCSGSSTRSAGPPRTTRHDEIF